MKRHKTAQYLKNERFELCHLAKKTLHKKEETEDGMSDGFKCLSMRHCRDLFSLLTASEAKDTMTSDDTEYLRAIGVEFRANEGMTSLENACEGLREKVGPHILATLQQVTFYHKM